MLTLKRIFYIGHDPLIVSAASKFGYGIAWSDNGETRVWFASNEEYIVRPDEVIECGRYYSPKVHIPTNLLAWSKGHTLTWCLKHRGKFSADDCKRAMAFWDGVKKYKEANKIKVGIPEAEVMRIWKEAE